MWGWGDSGGDYTMKSVTMADVELARHILTIGAPKPRKPVRLADGARLVDLESGLIYAEFVISVDIGAPLQREVLPLLSGPCWTGWVFDEAVQRGFWVCLSTRGDWAVTCPGFSRTGGPGSRSEALVAILEATRTEGRLPASAQAGGAIRFTIGSGSAGEPGESTKLVLPPFTSGVIKVS